MRFPSTVLILALAVPASVHAQAPAAAPPAAESTATPGTRARRPGGARRARHSVIARNVGFHVQPDGTSRCEVHVSGAVTPTSNASPRRFEIVLPGAVAATRNDMHPLETQFFNTPMRRAHLARRGRDLVLVVELRADVTPTMRVENDPAGGIIVIVDLPAGNYVEGPATPGGGSVRLSDQPGDQPPRPAQAPQEAAPAPAAPTTRPAARSAHDDDERPPGLR